MLRSLEQHHLVLGPPPRVLAGSQVDARAPALLLQLRSALVQAHEGRGLGIQLLPQKGNLVTVIAQVHARRDGREVGARAPPAWGSAEKRLGLEHDPEQERTW